MADEHSENIILFPGAAPQHLLVFRVELILVPLPVWRRIAVPSRYSFWDLHVAIQDALGWEDCHLHLFTTDHPESGERAYFGIPDTSEFHGAREIQAGWRVSVAEWFRPDQPPALYTYDFGDDWQHEVTFERWSDPEPNIHYPVCLAGEGACPPEDSGGPHVYAQLVKGLKSDDGAAVRESRALLGADFDPAAFVPADVRFDDPRQRWERAFGRR
jgi:hypothetical protein